MNNSQIKKAGMVAVMICATATCTIHSALFNKRGQNSPTHSSSTVHQQQHTTKNFCSGYNNLFYGNNTNNICRGNHNYFHHESHGNICWGSKNNIYGNNNWIIGEGFEATGDNKIYLSRKAAIIATLMVGMGAVLLKEAIYSLLVSSKT